MVVLILVANAAGVGLIWRNRQLQIHREREEWFRTVANDTPAYLWMSSATYKFFINKPFAEFLGTDEEISSGTGRRYVHPEDAEWSRARFIECRPDLRVRRGVQNPAL